jgi:class 3 adenylate cyclase
MAESRAQRRLSAILAADVVGYSHLMETDETGTLSRLKTLRRDIIDPFTSRVGRIVKLMGHGVLVVGLAADRSCFEERCIFPMMLPH